MQGGLGAGAELTWAETQEDGARGCDHGLAVDKEEPGRGEKAFLPQEGRSDVNLRAEGKGPPGAKSQRREGAWCVPEREGVSYGRSPGFQKGGRQE